MDGVPDEVVGELVAVAGNQQEAVGESDLAGGERRGIGRAREPCGQERVEGAAEHGPGAQHRGHAGAAAVEPGQDGGLEGRRSSVSAGGEVAEDLHDEERVPPGAPDDLGRPVHVAGLAARAR